MRRFFPMRAFYLDRGMSDGMTLAKDLYDSERLSYVERRIGTEEEIT